MSVRTASCACGQLQIECTGEPQKVSLCHCLDCQRRTGSAFGIAAFFTRDAVRPCGRDRVYTRASDSGKPVTFHFCPECGASVFWEPERLAACVAVAVGAFADPSFPAPRKAVWVERRHAWVRLDSLPAAGD